MSKLPNSSSAGKDAPARATEKASAAKKLSASVDAEPVHHAELEPIDAEQLKLEAIDAELQLEASAPVRLSAAELSSHEQAKLTEARALRDEAKLAASMHARTVEDREADALLRTLVTDYGLDARASETPSPDSPVPDLSSLRKLVAKLPPRSPGTAEARKAIIDEWTAVSGSVAKLTKRAWSRIVGPVLADLTDEERLECYLTERRAALPVLRELVARRAKLRPGPASIEEWRRIILDWDTSISESGWVTLPTLCEVCGRPVVLHEHEQTSLKVPNPKVPSTCSEDCATERRERKRREKRRENKRRK